MPLPIHIDSTYAASGFGVGLLVGLTGVGGGSLNDAPSDPVIRDPPDDPVGTDLLQASKSVGSLIP